MGDLIKIGVIGSEGFIGSYLINAINKLGVIYERFDRSKYNLSSTENLESFVKGKDIIFHLAGKNKGSTFELMENNTICTSNLIEAIKLYNASCKLIFTSSFQVYKPANDVTPISESHTLEPKSTYGLSKMLAEKILEFYSKNYGIKSIVVRMSNVYGLGCKPYYNSVLSTFVDLLHKNKSLSIHGSGRQARDFVNVNDVTDALIKLIDYNSYNFEVFNICSGRLTSLNEIVNILKDITPNIKVENIKVDSEENEYLLGDATKIKNKLNWIPKINLKEGLKEMMGKW
jgi:UDP-glucose 4-epimerase